jgi:hypothetical protein
MTESMMCTVGVLIGGATNGRRKYLPVSRKSEVKFSWPSLFAKSIFGLVPSLPCSFLKIALRNEQVYLVLRWKYHTNVKCRFTIRETDDSVLVIRYALYSQKCALALSLLPKAHGDAAMWSSMIRRVLIAINTELEYAFAGMEDGMHCFTLEKLCLFLFLKCPLTLLGLKVVKNLVCDNYASLNFSVHVLM